MLLEDSSVKREREYQSKVVISNKKKVIKYLLLTDLTLLAFKTSCDTSIIQSIMVSKDNFINFLQSDILYCCGIKVWQILLLSISALPFMIMNQSKKKGSYNINIKL